MTGLRSLFGYAAPRGSFVLQVSPNSHICLYAPRLLSPISEPCDQSRHIFGSAPAAPPVTEIPCIVYPERPPCSRRVPTSAACRAAPSVMQRRSSPSPKTATPSGEWPRASSEPVGPEMFLVTTERSAVQPFGVGSPTADLPQRGIRQRGTCDP
ncbi:hypothetical protein LX36DRAFT_661499 [Colletotrichum falcatum]|nr:hypothetical protein LX36DRAFT_661499 [Colletotrichum falcatum]